MRDGAVDTEEYRGLTIKLYHDNDCHSPIEDDDVFITYRKGSRYTLGNTPIEPEEARELDARLRAKNSDLIALNVYAYIHSGTALATTPFGDPWDSGQSGVIYITKKTALDWMGGKILTKKKRAQVIKNLEGIVEEYGKWCNGECYGYVIEDAKGEHLDSCWGFIGSDYAMKEAEIAADNCADDQLYELVETSITDQIEAQERKRWEYRDVVTA